MWPAARGDHGSSGTHTSSPGVGNHRILHYPLQPEIAGVVFRGDCGPAVENNAGRLEVIQKIAGCFRRGNSSQEDQGDKYIFDVNYS